MSCIVCGGSRPSFAYVNERKPFRLHRIPNKPEKAVKWHAIFPKTNFNRKDAQICNNHFIDVDYEDNYYGGKLRKDAIPRTFTEIMQHKKERGNCVQEVSVPVLKKLIVTDIDNPILSVPVRSKKKPKIKKVGSDTVKSTYPKVAISNVCRVCLSKGCPSVVPIQAVTEERSVADMIHYVSGIKVSQHDNLPQFVCSVCLKNLLTSCKTKDLCIESDRSLHWKWVDNDADVTCEEEPIEVLVTDSEPQNDIFETEVEQDQASEVYSDGTFEQYEMLEDECDKSEVDLIEKNSNAELETPPEELLTEEIEYDYDDESGQQIESIITTDDEEQELELVEKLDDSDTHQIFRDHNYLEQADEEEDDEMIEYLTEESIETFTMQSPDPKNSQKFFKCFICTLQFSTDGELDQHLSTSHRNEVLLCYICGHECRNSQALDEHLRKHDGTMLYAPSTTIPSDKFTIQYLQDENVQTKKSSAYVCKIIRKCYICGETFKNRTEKREHLRELHTDVNLHCQLCPRKFKTAIGLDIHLSDHENLKQLSFMCHICSKCYTRGRDLDAHIRFDHESSAQHECDYCGYKSKKKVALRLHIQSVHLQIKKYTCEHCIGFNYASKRALVKHQIARHGLETPFKCGTCLRCFTAGSYLKKHYAKCSGLPARVIDRVDVNIYREEIDVDTYQCKLCNMIFSGYRSKDRISIHYASAHKYFCDYCHRTFQNKIKMQNHIYKFGSGGCLDEANAKMFRKRRKKARVE